MFLKSGLLKIAEDIVFVRVWQLRFLGGNTCWPVTQCPILSCSYDYVSVLCLSLGSCLTLLSDLLTTISGGNNLFGKYGPNLDLSVGLVLGWVYMLGFGLNSGPRWRNVGLSGVDWSKLTCICLRSGFWFQVLV